MLFHGLLFECHNFELERLCLQLNCLKRYLRLQSLPSLQDAYVLPESPHHMATITGSMHNMQLAIPTAFAAHSPKPTSQHSAGALHSSPHPGTLSSMQRKKKAHTSLNFSNAETAARAGGQQHAPAAVKVKGGLGVRFPKRDWDDSGIQRVQSSLTSSIDSQEEERYWEQQDRLRVAEQQRESCKAHLAW